MPSYRQAPTAHTFQKERAARNLTQLAGYVKWMNISTETLLKLADSDGNRKLNYKEFSAFLTAKLGFKISEDEI